MLLTNSALLQCIKQDYGRLAKWEDKFRIRFREESSGISLDIPEDGEVTNKGWRILPHYNPTVSNTIDKIETFLLSVVTVNTAYNSQSNVIDDGYINYTSLLTSTLRINGVAGIFIELNSSCIFTRSPRRM